MRSIALIALLMCGTVCSPQEMKSARPLPGDGVADPAGKVGFFPNTKAGIDAIDLATGKLLWSSKEGIRPLLAIEGRLFVQKTEKPNQVRVLVLDTKEGGKRMVESQPIVFPDWVSVSTALGRTFHGGARVNIDGLWLSWEARAFYAGGARPTPEIEEAARKAASGVFRVDLDTGKIEALAADRIKTMKLLPIANEPPVTKVGNLTMSIEDMPAKMGNPFQMRRMIRATNDMKQVVWQHEIAAPVFIPPPP